MRYLDAGRLLAEEVVPVVSPDSEAALKSLDGRDCFLVSEDWLSV